MSPYILYSLQSLLIDSDLVQLCIKFESIKKDRRKYQILESISPSWRGWPTHSLTCAKMLPRNKSSNASAHKSACRRPTHEKEVGGTTRLATRTSIQIFKQKCHHILNQILESISPRRTRAPKYMVMCAAVLAWNIEHRQPTNESMHASHTWEGSCWDYKIGH
jgi:hypothetical protein